MDDITLQQIEIFLTVAERLSVSSAARELFINQAAVSRWIQRLEESLNATLFIRTNHGVELTEEGTFLYKELKPMLGRVCNTMRSIRLVYEMPENILRVGCLGSKGIIEKFTEKIKPFEESHPDVLLDIQHLRFPELRENLVCENVDCIVSYSLGFGEYREVETKKIHMYDSYFAISQKRPMAALDYIAPEYLEDETLYLLSLAEMKDAEYRALRECAACGFVPRRFKYMPSREALMLAVRNNRGIAIGGGEFGKEFRQDIKLYKIEKPVQNQYLIIAWLKSRMSNLTREFVDSFAAVTDEDECWTNHSW